MANPTLLDMPIAVDGDKNTIPTTTTPTTGLLSQQYGWRDINSMPVTQGGKAPNRKDFNGVFNLLSNILFYAQKGWQFEWDSSQAYYAGCIVKDTSDGKMYMCINDVTSTTAPHSDTTNWQLWDLSMLANYLPLSGGAMTGDSIERSVSNRLLSLSSRTSGHAGAHLLVFGGEDNEVDMTRNGAFQFVAQKKVSGTVSTSTMTGQPSGELEWNGNDLGGSAIVAKSITRNGYIKYASGLILQWGYAWIDSNKTQGSVTFPIAFTARSVIICDANKTDATVMTAWPSSTGASVYTNTPGSYSFDWFAIGY